MLGKSKERIPTNQSNTNKINTLSKYKKLVQNSGQFVSTDILA